MILFYNLFIRLYWIGISIAALWNKKAAQWIEGRKDLFENLNEKINKEDKIIWMHCASAGEFEQGKPVLEKLKEKYPQHKIFVSFFSPSGFGAGKKYAGADQIFYLPLDTKQNAEKLIAIIKPQLVVFVKYEFWYHHLKTINSHKIPLLIISAIFRKDQIFFKSYGSLYKNMLHFFNQIFVQDEASYNLLKSYKINNCTIAGDTRFDRVLKIASNASPVKYIPEFVGNKKAIIAGSTWSDDERIFQNVIDKNKEIKLIIAPHEINENHIKFIISLFPTALLYSKINEHTNFNDHTILIIDNVGKLSRLYQYATITFIGGGFNISGIHNTLEAAVYGKPVIFGPNYQKFKEARELIREKGAYSINNAAELESIINSLLINDALLNSSSNAAKNYVQQNAGATKIIVDYIQEKRLLTK